MSPGSFFIVGVLTSSLFSVAAIILTGSHVPTGSQNACRSANPGYECVVGWVKGEPFK
jgi:hypothetical protein